MTYGTLVHRPLSRRSVLPILDRLIADFDFNLAATPTAPSRQPTFAPRITAQELEHAYRIVAEVPGVEAKDLDVNVEGGMLTIKGERSFSDTQSENAEPSANVATADASAVTFERKVRLPGKIVETEVSASLRNGILTVTVPKQLAVKPEVRRIPIETA